MNGDVWAQVQAERRSGGLSEEDALERAIDRRKALYAAGLFAKVSASVVDIRGHSLTIGTAHCQQYIHALQTDPDAASICR